MKQILSFLKQHSQAINEIELEKFYFWELGKLLNDQVYDFSKLSWYLQKEYGNRILITKRNLSMIAFFNKTYSKDPMPEFPNVTWYQHCFILKSNFSLEQKLELLKLCQRFHWSTNQLKAKIKERNIGK